MFGQVWTIFASYGEMITSTGKYTNCSVHFTFVVYCRCNQLVLRTVRTTFHMVDKKTKQIEKNVNKRNRLLQDAFLPDATQTVEFFNRPSLTDIKSWIKLDSSQSHFHISSESGVLPHLLLLSLNESREFIAIFNAMKETQRIFGCASDFLDSTNSNQTIW